MYRVAILVSESVAMFELGCAIELFALPRPEIDNWYQADIVSFDHRPLPGTGGVLLSVKAIEHLDDYDMLVIPNWNTDNPALEQSIIDQVHRFYARGGRILSFCSGAFFIAEAGLLNGQEATTHWRYADKFCDDYPGVEFVENVLYVYRQRIGCSAGSAAAIDLGLEVIRQDYGFEVANQIARRMVVSPHRSGGQAQFVETPVVQNHSLFSATLDWAIAHLDQPLTVDELAAQAAMSRRSFDRHFRAALGSTPKEWLTRQRIKLAQKLLETDGRDMESIAAKSGFGNAMVMRHHFRAVLSISPSQYRGQFARRAGITSTQQLCR